MDLKGSINPDSNNWTWTWSGGLVASGQTQKNHDFTASGPLSITLTVSQGSCNVSVTQIVNVP
jgi:PKD repeat protein